MADYQARVTRLSGVRPSLVAPKLNQAVVDFLHQQTAKSKAKHYQNGEAVR